MDASTPERYDFGYSRIDELESASLRNTSTQAIIKQHGYAYDSASNRVSTGFGPGTWVTN
jgi:hypothetical protein